MREEAISENWHAWRTGVLCIQSRERDRGCGNEDRRVVPEANVAYAHGQMKGETELENIMPQVYQWRSTCLCPTTIDETGPGGYFQMSPP